MNFQRHLHNFNHFTNLQNLSFAESDLGLGFSWPWCGTGWDNPEGQGYLENGRQAALKRLVEGVETTIIQNGRSLGQCKLRQLMVGKTAYIPNNEGKLILLHEGQ